MPLGLENLNGDFMLRCLLLSFIICAEPTALFSFFCHGNGMNSIASILAESMALNFLSQALSQRTEFFCYNIIEPTAQFFLLPSSRQWTDVIVKILVEPSSLFSPGYYTATEWILLLAYWPSLWLSTFFLRLLVNGLKSVVKILVEPLALIHAYYSSQTE
jgi:hypothetical protein